MMTHFQSGQAIVSLTDTPLPSLLAEHTSGADVLRVEDGSGPGCFALTLKQMRNNGCDVFGEAPMLTAFCCTADAGPDQKFSKKLAQVRCSKSAAAEFHFGTDCFKVVTFGCHPTVVDQASTARAGRGGGGGERGQE